MRSRVSIALAAVACIFLIACSRSAQDPSEHPSAPDKPAKRNGPAPDIFHVVLDTSIGNVDIEVHRDWAPRGADHFYDLVNSGFYDANRFFRVVPDFVVQFGISGNPRTNALWASAMLPDDPVKEHNDRGTVTYAKRGPNTRGTQVFINLKDNSADLDKQGFAPFGKVVTGLDVVEKFYRFYGEMGPKGPGPDPGKIQQYGNDYLQVSFPRLDWIKTATIQ